MDFITPSDIAQIQEDVRNITQDVDLASNILYRHLKTSVFDPTTGQMVHTYDEYTFKGCGGDHSLNEVARSGGVLKLGDKVFTFIPSEINNLMTIGDHFYVGLSGAGGITVTAGSKTIVGIDTRLVSDGVVAGDLLAIDGEYGTIASIQGNENAMLVDNWAGESVIEAQYAIYRRYSIVHMNKDVLGVSLRVSVRRSGQ